MFKKYDVILKNVLNIISCCILLVYIYICILTLIYDFLSIYYFFFLTLVSFIYNANSINQQQHITSIVFLITIIIVYTYIDLYIIWYIYEMKHYISKSLILYTNCIFLLIWMHVNVIQFIYMRFCIYIYF